MRHFWHALVLLLLLPTTAVAAEYLVAHDSTWPPFEFRDSNKQISGYSVDYIAAVAKEAEFGIVTVHIPWNGTFARLAKGEAHIIGSPVSITEERKKNVSFSLPYFVTSQRLLVPRNSTVASLEDLKGSIIGVQAGTTSQVAANSHPGLTVRLYDELLEALSELAAGNLGGIIADSHTAEYFASMPAYKNVIRSVTCPITKTDEEYAFVVKKSDKALLQKINKGIIAVKEKGLDKELYKKWFGQGEAAR